jgi:hypothetical protein
MNVHKSKDQQAIAKLVRAFVSPSTAPQAMAEVVCALKSSIRSPSDIIRCETIPDQHFLKREALVIRDAFEAATNGMSAPDAFQALEGIQGDSVFAPWKDLIAAVAAFYDGNEAELSKALARIEPDSFSGRAAGLWEEIFSRMRRGDPGYGQARDRAAALNFLEKLFPESDSMSIQAEELIEALDEGMTDLFNSGCGRFFRELSQRSRGAAVRAALFILSKIDAKGQSPDDFLSILKSCFGEAESLRLTALYLSDSRPTLALLFWIKAASRSLEESPGEESLAAWSLVLERAAERAAAAEKLGKGRAGEFRAALDPLVERFTGIARLIMPDIASPLAANARERLSSVARVCRAAFTTGNGKRAARGTRKRDQLELFA